MAVGVAHELRRFSAALCRGLIEAMRPLLVSFKRPMGFPRLYAAASLKRAHRGALFSVPCRFSAALCRGLIEARTGSRRSTTTRACFPRLYAAASLKPLRPVHLRPAFPEFSAALCRGLIEAAANEASVCPMVPVFRGFMPRPH